MTRPRPTGIYHFTHLRNLPGIIQRGLRCDADCPAEEATRVQIGDSGIRDRRLQRPVGVGPGGYVGDYVPWYFAPRSPMMYTLSRGNHDYHDGFDEVVYLQSSVEAVVDLGRSWVASDRNAALAIAEFTAEEATLGSHVTWDVMPMRYWTDYPDGKELRMAEFLVHRQVPWQAVHRIVVKTESAREAVTEMMRGLDHVPEVAVVASWYF